MKPAHIYIVLGFAIAALLIWYFFVKKAPQFDMNAYNSLGNEGIVQGNMDNPYCSKCQAAMVGAGNGAIANSINYKESDTVYNPTFLAQQRVVQQLS